MNVLKNNFTIFILFLIALPNFIFSQDDESYYQQISRAIIRLEDVKTGKPIGTAFFVNNHSDSTHYYLVTARHVVESNRILRARVSSQRLDNSENEVIELRLPKDIWIYHPLGSYTIKVMNKYEKIFPIDVAITKLPPIKGRRLKTIGYNETDDKKNQISLEKVEPPNQIIVWGFPGDLGFNLEEQRPLGRVGIVAMTANEPFIRTKNSHGELLLRDEQVLLIDAPILPGNSGSPIFDFTPFKGNVMLIGLISAANISNSYAVVEPSTRIIETIENAFNMNQKIMGSWHMIK